MNEMLKSVKSKTLFFVVLLLVCLSPAESFADTITIVHGDQYVMTLTGSDIVKIEQTILFSSNKTANAYMEEIGSIDGALVGEPAIVADSSIESALVDWKSVENITTLIVRVNVTLQPSKFKAVRLTYSLAGVLQHQNDGTWLLNRVFNMTAGSVAPPEIVVKVPKPSQWEELKLQEIVPTPSSVIEEEGFYVMTWKSSAVTFENTTETFVRLRYSLSFSPMKVLVWFTPPIFGFLLGFITVRLWDKREEIKSWIKKHKHVRMRKVRLSFAKKQVSLLIAKP